MLLTINTFCTDSNGKTTSYSLIHYGFQCEEHEIQHPPHRNASKGSTPYKRTKPSTMQRIKEIAKDHKAKEVIETIDSEKGSIEHVSFTVHPISQIWLLLKEYSNSLALLLLNILQ